MFVYLYFIRRGFLDGRPGLLFCLLRVANEIHMAAKLAEADQAVAAGTSVIQAPRENDAEAARDERRERIK